jgi:hypothetical protein
VFLFITKLGIINDWACCEFIKTLCCCPTVCSILFSLTHSLIWIFIDVNIFIFRSNGLLKWTHTHGRSLGKLEKNREKWRNFQNTWTTKMVRLILFRWYGLMKEEREEASCPWHVHFRHLFTHWQQQQYSIPMLLKRLLNYVTCSYCFGVISAGMLLPLLPQPLLLQILSHSARSIESASKLAISIKRDFYLCAVLLWLTRFIDIARKVHCQWRHEAKTHSRMFCILWGNSLIHYETRVNRRQRGDEKRSGNKRLSTVVWAKAWLFPLNHLQFR